MNIIAVILAAVAIVLFILDKPKTTDLGLAFFTAAFVAAFVVQAGPTWIIR